MKLQLLVVDAGAEIILTPESPAEKAIVQLICEHKTANVFKGKVEWDRNRVGYFREFDSPDSALLILQTGEE